MAPTARRVQVPGLGGRGGLSGWRTAWPGRDLGGRPCGRERPRLTFWPRRSSYLEGPHLLRGAARGGSEHAQRFPEVATRRARETPVCCLPSSPHQDQGTRCASAVLQASVISGLSTPHFQAWCARISAVYPCRLNILFTLLLHEGSRFVGRGSIFLKSRTINAPGFSTPPICHLLSSGALQKPFPG